MNKHILYKMIAQKKARIIIIISTWHITSQKDPFFQIVVFLIKFNYIKSSNKNFTNNFNNDT